MVGILKMVCHTLDNLRAHHAKIFKAWLGKYEKEIEIFYLPSYSPELNPDEYLNCDLKPGIVVASLPGKKSSLRKKFFHICACCKRGRIEQQFYHSSTAR